MGQSPIRKLLIIVVLIFLAWGSYQAIDLVMFAYRPALKKLEKPRVIEVQASHSPSRLAATLESEGIVDSGKDFLRLGRIWGKWKYLKVGEYEMRSGLTPIEVFSVISSGISVRRSVTIREGANIYQIADALEKVGIKNFSRSDFLRLCKDRNTMRELGFSDPMPPSLEGFLFPETYFFNKSMKPKEVIEKMYQRFNKEWSESDQEQASRLGMTKNEIIVMASIIEKETGAPEERSLISSVFHNRLRKKMRLQSDPTTIYGVWETFGGNLRKNHLKEKTVYNTYTFRGLPIGAIANPGRESIQAALYPIRSQFLYFVSKNDGTHQFTSTFQEHSKAVKKFQLDQKARQGKSWRDLNKRGK